MLGSIRDRLTFANAIAVLALFVSLGGASYAAIRLPARSVGTAQLKNGAVGKRALAFGLGQAGVSRENLGAIVDTGGCVPRPDGTVPPCVPPRPFDPLSKTVKLKRSAALRISAVVNVSGSAVKFVGPGWPAHPDGRAQIELSAKLDGKPVSGEASATVGAGEEIAIPYLGQAASGRGRHTVSLYFSGSGYDYVNATISSATLSVTALPRF